MRPCKKLHGGSFLTDPLLHYVVVLLLGLTINSGENPRYYHTFRDEDLNGRVVRS